MTYQIAAGIEAFAVGGDWFDMRLMPIKTGKLNIFKPSDVVVSPEPGVNVKAKHGLTSATAGGNYARIGYYAFRGAGNQYLVVHKSHVQLIEGSKNGGAETKA